MTGKWTRVGAHAALVVSLSLVASSVRAQEEPMGAPPPDLEPVAAGPTAPAEAPDFDAAPQGTTLSAAAGGLSSTGNSRLVAATVNAAVDSRVGDNGFGASVVGNYGRGAAPGEPLRTTVENIQGRLRYDRYVLDDASVFMIATGRRDRLQGVAFRLNLDPGFKYLLINRRSTALWGELGYDFQYDRRTAEARLVLDDMGNVVDTLDPTATDHSVRSFVGFRQAFNDDVALSTGLEYLQSFIDTNRFRLNYDLLFTARVAGAFSLGAGFTARYDNAPLPDKAKLDTTTSLSLVYSFTTIEPESGG